MAETGATSNNFLYKDMKSMFKTLNLEELRGAMDLLPEETRKELLHKTDGNLMFQACFSKATQIVEYFIVECKADINEAIKIKDETLTALFIAVKTGNIDLINLLLKHGADINWRDPEIKSAIVYACYHNKMEAAHTLRKHGADINDDTNIELSAKSLAYLKRALKLGANVNYIDGNGETIFMKAIENDNVDVINLLLKEKADLYVRNNYNGMNALDFAYILDKEEILAYFINNSVYSLTDKVLSYEFCGALNVLIENDIEKALGSWIIAAKLRRKHSATMELLKKVNPVLNNGLDLGSDKFLFDCISLSEHFKFALRVVCRILDVNHTFVGRSFSLVAYNRYFYTSPLTFDTLREYCQINSTSLVPMCNGVFVGMTGAICMGENHIWEETQDVDTTALFIEQMVDLITEEFVPIMKQWPGNGVVFKAYKQLLMILLHLIDYIIDEECSDMEQFQANLWKIAGIYVTAYPTSMLLIAIERGFSFKTVFNLIAAGADVNAGDYLQNRPLHLLAEQPDHIPDKGNIRQLLIDSGAEIDATNAFGIKSRISEICN